MSSPGPVALVLVSHVRAAAEGVARIAGQMAPDVRIVPVGGTPEDGIGTDLDGVQEGLEVADAAAGGAGVVVLTDLGSAVLTAETALELIDAAVAERVELADAPFLEGAVAAAVAAQQGAARDRVRAAAEGAADLFGARGSGSGQPAGGPPEETRADGAATRDGAEATVVLRNPLGLHARPAALLARLVADQGVPVTIDGRDGSSVLELMALGAAGGHELRVHATGPGATQAVEAVVDLVETGFGET